MVEGGPAYVMYLMLIYIVNVVRCHWVGLTFVRHYAVKPQDHDARNGVILVDRHSALQ